jgi:hypothetical protein
MEFAQVILQYLTSGGAGAVIALLFGVIIILIMDRRNISKTLDSTIQRVYDAKDSETKSITEIVNRYHQGNLDLVQALNEIKIVLTTIQNSRK